MIEQEPKKPYPTLQKVLSEFLSGEKYREYDALSPDVHAAFEERFAKLLAEKGIDLSHEAESEEGIAAQTRLELMATLVYSGIPEGIREKKEPDSPEVQEALVAFREEIPMAVEMAEGGMGGAFEALPSFWELEGHEDAMLQAVREELEVAEDAKPAHTVIEQGPEDSPGAGEQICELYATNVEGVFLSKEITVSGDISWIIRPLELINPDDEEEAEEQES